ncbi:hypothetical protein NBO_24g0033 [Nosema bombycis CQ1]|jgi:hypothetical protein|uniref:Uncharacterized protein n=1 Tax=Nosema bombycis (strain CQ1 / CVCC 102059) TaxID=578461 RepID=R0MNZ1_NOSB1|nr:hypothetical protein NBO_24g0033 [Nosema bombycis CQ1]|eukprot:EOB14588.1 hypothetical protein NBO_24g0033 [Nosema bombycis CQ1]
MSNNLQKLSDDLNYNLKNELNDIIKKFNRISYIGVLMARQTKCGMTKFPETA